MIKDAAQALSILSEVQQIGLEEKMKQTLQKVIDHFDEKYDALLRYQKDGECQALVKFKEIAKEYGLNDEQAEQAYSLIIAATISNINDDDGVELVKLVLDHGDDVVERMLESIYEFENRHISHGIVRGVLQNAKSTQ